jgi:phosphonate transport system substrate-binding protein
MSRSVQLAAAAWWLALAPSCRDPSATAAPRHEVGEAAVAAPRVDLRAVELRFAVGPMLSPVATFEAYRSLLASLAASLDRPYRFLQRRTYAEVNLLLVDGEVDLAFICAGPYAVLPRQGVVEIIAVPVVEGKTTYRGVVVVPRQSPVSSFAELEGKRFAYTDPLSSTGYLYPASTVVRMGRDPATFFASTLFSGSHDRSLMALRQDLVDAAAVYDLNFERLTRTVGGADVRVIDRSPEYSMPPVVAPLSVPAPLRQRLRELLLALDDTPSGRAILAELGADRFVADAPLGYEPIRRNWELLRASVP